MTVVVSRARWVQIVKRFPLPASRRVMRSTLLQLADLMVPSTGELSRWWDEMEGATGLPRRTLERHIGWAVEYRLLVHTVRGGHGRKGGYAAADPESCPPPAADNGGQLSAACSRTTPESCPPLGGGVKEQDTSARVSGHQAEDGTHGSAPTTTVAVPAC